MVLKYISILKLFCTLIAFLSFYLSYAAVIVICPDHASVPYDLNFCFENSVSLWQKILLYNRLCSIYTFLYFLSHTVSSGPFFKGIF